MKTTTTTKTRTIETPHDAAKRILLGDDVDPSLTPDKVRELVELHDEAARKGDDVERDRWRIALLDRRRANAPWPVVDEDGELEQELPDAATVAILMDIRDELRAIREALGKATR